MSIIDNLDDFSPEELEIASRILGKLAGLKKAPELSSEKKVEQPPKKRGRPKKQVVIETKPLNTQKGKGRKTPSKPVEQPTEIKVGRSSRHKKSHKNDGREAGDDHDHKHKGKGKMAMVQPLSVGGPNKFLKMSEFAQCRSDAAIDKKLWKGVRPVERRDEIQFVEVRCDKCGYYFDVHPDLIFRDPDGELMYKCNDCSRG